MSDATCSCRRRVRHRHRRRHPDRARRRARLVPVPLRAAARAGLPLDRDRRHPGRPQGGRRRPPGARSQPAVHRELLADLHPARHERDGDRLVAERAQSRPSSRSAASLIIAMGVAFLATPVHRHAQPPVALRVAAAPRRPRRAAASRARRSRSPGRRARASPSARSSRRRRSRARPPTARCCSPSTPPASRSRSC